MVTKEGSLVLLLVHLMYTSARPTGTVCPDAEVKKPQNPFKASRVIFSEINTDFPSREPKQFVELTKVYDSAGTKRETITLDKFRLLLIDGLQKTVVMNCNLKGVQIMSQGKSCAVIGSKDTTNVDMEFSKCQSSFEDPNYIPKGSDHPYALALVYHKDVNYLNVLDLDFDVETNRYLPLDLESTGGKKFTIKKVITTNLQDFFVYGSITAEETCRAYNDITELYVDEGLSIERDWQGLEMFPDFSLNKCEGKEPFQSSTFKLSRPSPGEINQCEKAFRFWQADDLDRFLPVFPYNPDDITDYGNCFPVKTNPKRFEDINIEFYSTQLAEKARGLGPVPHVVVIPENEKTLWPDCSKFPQEWKDYMVDQAHIIPVDEIQTNPDYCSIINYIPRQDLYGKYTESRLQCKICNQGVREILGKGEVNYIFQKDLMASNIGFLISYDKNNPTYAYNENSKHLKLHNDSVVHQFMVQYWRLRDAGISMEDALTDMKGHEGPFKKYYQATINLFTSGLQTLRMEVPFLKFRQIQKLLKHFNVNTGTHFSGKQGLIEMAKTMSKVMRREWLKEFQEVDKEFTIQVDESTDIQSIHTMVVIFYHYNRKMEVVTSLYSIIELGVDLSAKKLFEQLLEKLREDGIEDIFKRRIIAFSSDGEAKFKYTMKNMLDKYVGRYIAGTHCLAHKEELSVLHAYEKFPYLRYVDEVVNRIHSFYTGSCKAFAHLKATIKRLGIPFFRFGYLYKIRFVSSRFDQLLKIYNHWTLLYNDLNEIMTETKVNPAKPNAPPEFVFPVELRVKAGDLMNEISDKDYLMHLGFILDFTSKLAVMSKRVQEKTGTFIGKTAAGRELFDDFQGWKKEDGAYLKSILADSKCNNQNPCKSVVEFETTEVVTYKNKVLTYDGPDLTTPLSEHRVAYMKEMQIQFQSYFPETVIQNFDIFDPLSIDERKDSWDNYGKQELENLRRVFKWNIDGEVLYREFSNMAISIINDPDFETMKYKKPEEFWKYYYNKAGIEWTDGTRKIIRIVLCIPASSAEVERLYSAYNRLKTKSRACLKVETILSLLTITQNHEDLSEVDMWPFVIEFGKTHIMADEKAPRQFGDDDIDTNAGADYDGNMDFCPIEDSMSSCTDDMEEMEDMEGTDSCMDDNTD